MEFVEIALQNFRRFKDARFPLSPCLTLIWGTNEAGKSSIHEAVSCALFGRERGKIVENWDGGNCTIELTYRLPETQSKLFRIERRLTEGVARIGTVTEGELTDVANSRDAVSEQIAVHLGIPTRPIFENTIYIRQMCVSKPGQSELETIGGEIQRVLTGTAHVSADEVMKKLEEGRDSIKGRARPANPREYDKITARLRELAEGLADARSSRDLIHRLDEEFIELEARIERDSARLNTVSGLLERHNRWFEKTRRLEELDGQHAEVFSTLRNILEALDTLDSIQQELGNCAELVDKDEEIADHLSKISSRRAELESRLGELQAGQKEAHSSRLGIVSLVPVSLGTLLTVAAIILGIKVDIKALWLAVPGLLLIAYQGRQWIQNSASGSKHISDMISSAQIEIGQLDAEEESILSYVNCRNSDQAWVRIKKYRSLVSKSHETEIMLKALLNNRSLKDWETLESNLARELSSIRTEIETDFAGYSPTTEEFESWRNEFATLQHQLPTVQARMHEVKGALESERRKTCDISALEGEIEYLHSRKQELEFVYKAYEEAISALSAVTQNVSEEYLPTLSEKAGDLLAWMTGGRYTSVDVKPGWEISVNSADHSEVSPSSLSAGTLDQLYFSLRLSCGELLSSGRKLPIILDDPFANFDRERLTNVLSLIAALARQSQILLLTHDPYILDWAENLASAGDVPCVVHKLPKPQTNNQQ